jgi:hypothetical protein
MRKAKTNKRYTMVVAIERQDEPSEIRVMYMEGHDVQHAKKKVKVLVKYHDTSIRDIDITFPAVFKEFIDNLS